jgi:hypothetical protein
LWSGQLADRPCCANDGRNIADAMMPTTKKQLTARRMLPFASIRVALAIKQPLTPTIED